jgi:GT2 family glycosyltransferase/glycosyltransferase involved in cell wall biosynthesis
VAAQRLAAVAIRRMTGSIDIVVPVYNAPDDVRTCVDSVLAHTDRRHRVTLIDDASPDPRIAQYFDELRAQALPHVTLLVNPVNLGFTGTANRGFALSRRDVVLLNSDTIVSRGWLDALMRCAASDPAIGTITPFSNNAEILSYPRFCVNNAWPDGADPSPRADAFARAAVPTYPDLPTGVGFCFYVRRALLDDIGGFDPGYGAGYGEENDFCLRAAAHGWRNVLADDAFVAHTGGRSFRDLKAALVPKNSATLLARHPGYDALVQGFIAADPLRALREAAATMEGVLASPHGGVLHVIHHHGGGTESHVRMLIEASRAERRHFLAVAVGDRWQVEEHRADGSVAGYTLERAPAERWPDFVGGLCASFGIGVVHLHNISACRNGLVEAMTTLDIPFGYTAHDLNFACPTITLQDASGWYCGGVTDIARCTACLAAQPAFASVDIAAWRERHRALVARAAFVVAPSQWAADMVERYFGRRPQVIAHGLASAARVADAGLDRPPLTLPDDGAAVVAVLGAVGPDKGARRLDRLVALARAQRARLRFVLIGYQDREPGPWQSEDGVFTVHGRYRPAALPGLLDAYRVDLVLFPSMGPETFSYTLSEAWAAGMPVLVPPIGALAERVNESGAGFVMTDAEWRDDEALLARVRVLLATDHSPAMTAAAARGSAMVPRTAQAMAADTLALYARAAAQSRQARPPLSRARLREALGYMPWHPPAPSAAVLAARRSLRTQVARIAMRMRRTRVGTSLYGRLPPRLLDALKSRLR